MRIAVLLACSPLRVEVDPLDGAVDWDPRLTGLSDADSAALEWALRVSAAWSWPLTAVTVGPPDSEVVLRAALAAGAADAVRVDAPDSGEPAALAAGAAAALSDISLVVAGTWSPRRGSGAVPALVAAGLGAAQALGLLSLDLSGSAGVLEAERRLDGGRRERLRIRVPAVLSMDAATASLRRAPLPAVLAARTAPIQVLPAPTGLPAGPPTRSAPLRPRAKVLEPPDQSLPARQRVLALTGGTGPATTSTRAVILDPPAAADRIIEALTAWGYLPAADPELGE